MQQGYLMTTEDFRSRLGPAVASATHWVFATDGQPAGLMLGMLASVLVFRGLPVSALLYGTIEFLDAATLTGPAISVLAVKKDAMRPDEAAAFVVV